MEQKEVRIMDRRTIKVTGKGKIAVKPDRIRLIINLQDSRENYDELLRQSAQQVDSLRDSFEKLGFGRTELKTTEFHVSAKYESYQSRDKAWKKRFIGYEFRHCLKLEFDADNEMLGKVLYALAHNPVDPEFRIVYTVKDVEAAKNLLLGKAVEDSRAKAEILTKAAGVKLGVVVTIDYSWDEVQLVSTPMSRNAGLYRGIAMEADGAAAYQADIEPEEINVSDQVTVVWEIIN